jgi:hypothetical protein
LLSDIKKIPHLELELFFATKGENVGKEKEEDSKQIV